MYLFSTIINYLGYIWFSYVKHKIIIAPYLLGYDTVPAGKQLVVTIFQLTWQHIHKHFHIMKMTDTLKMKQVHYTSSLMQLAKLSPLFI